MENSNKIIPPHLNAEVYRSDTTGTNTLSYFDHIHLHPDGSVLIGCSELTGRYWNGAANVFKTVVESQERKGDGKCISLASGTNDGCFLINSNKVLLCEDTGTVSVWSINNEDAWKTWNEETSVCEHDDAVLSVDCLVPGEEYVTGAADGNIKVWDVADMICIRNYSAAHTMAICDVAVKPKSATSFATASLDQYVTLWDDNIAKPVTDLVKNDCGVRCLQWLDENRLVYGDEAGALRFIDVRNTETVHKLTEFPAAVHGIAVHSESDKIAVCCDNKIVTVYELSDGSKAKEIYNDRHMHTNYVRGVVWDLEDKNSLHSVGWDGVVRSHKVVCD